MKLQNCIDKLAKWNKYFIIPMLLIFFSIGTAFSAPDNAAYKEWCIDTFYNGDIIYEAYRVINFDIEGKLDVKSGYFDFWQKPQETLRLKTGDCEDFMILFSDLILGSQDNFEIVWGFVYDKSSIVKSKHVWGQLTGKDGQLYILEGGQGDWDGIQKQEIIEKTQFRDPIVIIPQRTYTLLQGLFLNYDIFDEIAYREIFGKDEPSSEAFHVFEMLHEMVTREYKF